MGKRNNFVETGRVCLVNYGPHNGKLVVIVDCINQSFALVDSANQNDFGRGMLNFKHMAITSMKVDIAHTSKSKAIEAAFKKADIASQFAASSWGKKLVRQAKRTNATDFDRFNTMLLRKKRSNIIGREMAKLKRANK